MKLVAWIIGAAMACVFAVRAQSLDDQYVLIYSLIQQGDSLLEARQPQAAIGKFLEAETGLKKLQISYPNWNDRVVAFRLRYVDEKLKEARSLAASAPPPAPTVVPTAPAPATPAVTAPAVDTRAVVAPLETQIRQLQADKANLEAKLREALSARPAGTDPAELTRIQDRVRMLQKENEILKVSLAQEKDRSARAADPAVVEQIRTALADSTRKLAAQADIITSLRKDNETLQARVKNNPEVAQLRTENQTLQKQVADLKLNTTLNISAGDLAKQLAETKAQLAIQVARVDTLAMEKSALETRLRELGSRPATPVNPAGPSLTEMKALNERIAGLEKDLLASRRTAADSAAALEKLQQEKSVLVAKVAEYALRSAMSQPPTTAPAGNAKTSKAKTPAPATLDADAMNERMRVLRARLEILEARPVPYSPEELALFKAPQSVKPAAATGTGRVPAKMLPSGAATLVAQAERAFTERRLDDAERLYSQIVKLDDRNAYTLANLAAIQLEKGLVKDAEAQLRRALETSPNDAFTLSLLGIARFRQDDAEDALNFLSRAAQIEPNNPETQNYLGVALSQKGLRSAAETALRKAIQLSPGYASAHHNLAVVYATAQPPSVELARFHYQRAISAGHPKNPELEKLLGPKTAAN